MAPLAFCLPFSTGNVPACRGRRGSRPVLGELGELDADFFQMQPRHFLVMRNPFGPLYHHYPNLVFENRDWIS